MLNEFFTKAIGLILSTTLIFGVLPLGTVSYDEGIDDISAETDLYTAERETNVDAEEAGQGAEDEEEAIFQAPMLKGMNGTHDGYVGGYDDGTFHPDDTLTRAEAAALLFRIIEAPGEERATYSDVSDSAWYGDAIRYLGAIGVFNAEEGNIYPNSSITRGEFASIIVRLMLGKGADWTGSSPYVDMTEDEPHYREICLATANGWFYGAEGKKFLPKASLTRAEAVVVINRLRNAVPDREYMNNYFFSPFSDVYADHWAYYDIMEATVSHTHNGSGTAAWATGDLSPYASPKGKYFVGHDYYYFGDDGRPVVNGTVGGLYFGADGRFTSGDEELDAYVKTALSSVVKPSMTDMEKLRAAYIYTRDSFTYLRRNYYDVGDVSWANKEANTMFSTGKGNCYCYSAVFYSLARQLGFDAVLISGKVNNSNPIPHAWVEIAEDGKIYMYDAELEMAHIRDGNPYDLWHMAYDATPWRYWR